jgi:hypothetical protein
MSGAHECGPGSGGNRDRRKGHGQSAAAHRSLNATIPTRDGELCISTEGTTCELRTWAVYAGGRMCAGAIRMDAQTLRVAIHALRQALHVVEHAEGRRAA